MAGLPKKQHCAYCGEYLGEYPSTYGVAESCGSAECERELRAERAREDRYGRY